MDKIVKCECGEWLGESCTWSGPRTETSLVEIMPEFLRDSHKAAGNWGRYPANGAIRVRVHRDCVEHVLDDEYNHIVGDAL